MSLRIISHCYAERLPQFAGFLRYQLASLINDPPKMKTFITICYTSNDDHTQKVLDEFSQIMGDQLHKMDLDYDYLWRRSIGRNIGALICEEDYVWFADVDHVFTPQCIDGIPKAFPTHASMIYPRNIFIQKTHTMGDISAKEATGLPRIDPDQFRVLEYHKAIGGVQIVRGDLAREWGYLYGHRKWHQPVEKPFGDFREDIIYRKVCRREGAVMGVDLPGLYRLRHTESTYVMRRDPITIIEEEENG